MPTATMNVRDALTMDDVNSGVTMNVREALRMNVRDALSAEVNSGAYTMNVREALKAEIVSGSYTMNVRDALSAEVVSGGGFTEDLAVLEDVRFEGDDLEAGEHLACLADPWVTATTRFACDD
jgi:hypothetical protein